METIPAYVAFANGRQIAEGTLREVLPVLKQRFDRDRSDMVLVFQTDTGRQMDFDLRGTLDEVLERAAPEPSKGPGRPRLGVVSREVSLLPQHWDWLEAQPAGASAALRRLVDTAIKNQPGKERARRIREAVSRFLTSIAGDRPNYEEATRALFAGESARFAELIDRWPKDIRDLALGLEKQAASAEKTG
jgi:hypothetical protein